jgi:hypothetical protein
MIPAQAGKPPLPAASSPEDRAQTHAPCSGFSQWEKALFSRCRDYRGDRGIVLYLPPLFLKKRMRRQAG